MHIHELNTRIERAEQIAIGTAMCGQWTRIDDDELAALYAERRRMNEEGTTHE